MTTASSSTLLDSLSALNVGWYKQNILQDPVNYLVLITLIFLPHLKVG